MGRTTENRPLDKSHGALDKIVHFVARIFNGLHWAIGITTLPENASKSEERSFVLMWLGLILLIVIVFAVMLYLL